MIDPVTRIMVLPLWSGAVTPVLMPGGLGNRSYLVDDAGARYVVRFGRDYPLQHVFRAWELMVSKAAHRAGFGAEIVHTGPGVFVGAYIDGVNCTPELVRDKVVPITQLMRRFHRDMPAEVSGAAPLFWPFHVVRDYARTLMSLGHRNAARREAWFDAANELEKAQVPLPIVFGHNDLVGHNIVDDGSRLWLVDYEHAAFTTSIADLAGLACHAEFDDAHTALMLETYFDGPPEPGVRRAYDALQAIMPLREALWGMIAEDHVDVSGVDFVAYGEKKLDAFERGMARFRARHG